MTYLSQHFSGVASKRLRPVEVDPQRSNQHEFNGVTPLIQLLGRAETAQTLPATFFYFGEFEDETVSCPSSITWYDARANHPTRSEHRLYYPTNEVMRRATAGDLFILAKQQPSAPLLIIVAKQNSTFENNLCWLFHLNQPSQQLAIHDFGSRDRELSFVARLLLEELKIPITEYASEHYLEQLLTEFGHQFPPTRQFSAFARAHLPHVHAPDDPDMALWQWVDFEEQLFRLLERHLVSTQIAQGFLTPAGQADVDAFISFSLSVQNRRKARIGLALEHHLEQIFLDHGLTHSRGQVTENKARPDFIFPHIEDYRNASFPTSRLTMLGVKSTCKDRWRQVLSEANRILTKHLFTLEPGISRNQTTEMVANQLQLVVPQALHETYQPDQRAWLMNLRGFLGLLRTKQVTS